MNRTLKLSMLVALALGSTQALALQLGQVQVKSALGEPLLAEIPLKASSADELKDLSVRLASSDAFTRAGIVGGRTDLPLQFSVVSRAGGQKFIRITTASAVDNPYLDLLLDVNDRNGTSTREVAILLDPASSQPMAAPAEPAAAISPRQHVANAGSAMRPPKSVAVARAPAARKNQYGPVQKGQSLTSIAQKTMLSGVDMAQMLLAYKQANPDAFYRDNINALKYGVVLRVPTAAQAQATGLASALAEVHRENSDWRGGAVSKPVTVADAGTGARSSSSPSQGGSGLTDRLALVPARDGQGGGSAGSAKDRSSSKLRQDLLRSQESLASLQQQGDDLKSRVKALADINDNNAHLLSLKDNEIAQLQAQLAAARKAAHLPPEPMPAGTSASAESAPAARGKSPVAAMAHSAAVTPAGSNAMASSAAVNPPHAGTTAKMAVTAPAAVAPVPKRKPMKPLKPLAAHHVYSPAKAAEQPWYMQTWAWAVAGGVVLVLLLLALIGRRRKPAMATPARPLSLADRFEGDQLPPMMAADGVDVDQDELLDQLAEHPEDIGLHLELVTLYYSRRDVEHFEAAAEAMHAHITSPLQDEWQDVLHMGEDLVPSHPLFDHHEELPVDEVQAARSGFDIDEYARTEETPADAEALHTPRPLGEYSFNFNLNNGSPHPSDAVETERVALDEEDVSVEPEDSADEHFLIEPEAGITDAGWDVDHAEHVPHEVAQLVAPEYPGAGTEAEVQEYVHSLDDFSDDPVDTKLDLARAYLDMGDAEGAQAMLGEVMREGTQMQRDTAKALLEKID